MVHKGALKIELRGLVIVIKCKITVNISAASGAFDKKAHFKYLYAEPVHLCIKARVCNEYIHKPLNYRDKQVKQ